MKFDTIIKIILYSCWVIMMVCFLAYMFGSMQDATDTLGRCQSKGYDGVSFPNRLSNRMICSNISQAEKDAMRSYP